MRQAYLFVRNLGTGSCPAIPDTWSYQEQDNKWVTIQTSPISVNNDGNFKTYSLASWRANTDTAGTQGLFVVFANEIEILDWAKDRESTLGAPLIDVWQARGSNAIALAALRRYPTYKIDGFIRDENGDPVAVSNYVVRLMQNEGFTLPNPNTTPLPWNLDINGQETTQALAVVRVTAIIRPALDVSIAGFQDNISAENQPTSGSL